MPIQTKCHWRENISCITLLFIFRRDGQNVAGYDEFIKKFVENRRLVSVIFFLFTLVSKLWASTLATTQWCKKIAQTQREFNINVSNMFRLFLNTLLCCNKLITLNEKHNIKWHSVPYQVNYIPHTKSRSQTFHYKILIKFNTTQALCTDTIAGKQKKLHLHLCK